MRQGTLGFIVWASLFLASCAGYQPQTLEVSDQTKYGADVSFCQNAAANIFKPSFSFGSVGFSAISGAASNSAAAVVGGIAIVGVGALGGASQAASNGLDLMGQAQSNVFRHCVIEKTRRDGSALVADDSPN